MKNKAWNQGNLFIAKHVVISQNCLYNTIIEYDFQIFCDDMT